MRGIARRLARGFRRAGLIGGFGGSERGMTTAEYAIGTVAAASFAALLLELLTSEQVRELLMKVIKAALGLAA